MLRPSHRIGVAELYEGAIFLSTLLDLLTAIGLYMSTCEKMTHTKSHVYLELSAKRDSIRTTSTCMREKTHILLYLFAKDMACTCEKTHLCILLDLSAKHTAIEFMYINMHVRGTFGTDSY